MWTGCVTAALAGLEWLFLMRTCCSAEELDARRKQSQQSIVDLELQMNRFKSGSDFSAERGAVPIMIFCYCRSLHKQGVDTITGAIFLRNLSDNEERSTWSGAGPGSPMP